MSPSARSWCEPAHWVAPPTGKGTALRAGKAQQLPGLGRKDEGGRAQGFRAVQTLHVVPEVWTRVTMHGSEATECAAPGVTPEVTVDSG